MDWNLVRLFIDVVDAGNMSEAARRRGITRSAVSQRLRLLEHQIQAQLLHRTTREVKPTGIGRTLYEHGQQIALQFEAAQNDVESLGKTLSGLVRVSVPPGVGEAYLEPALFAFADAHPDLALKITFNNRLSNMLEADVDIALRILPRPPEELIARELGDVHWHFYSTPLYLERMGGCERPADLERAAFLSTTGARYNELTLVSPTESATVTLRPRFVSESVVFLRSSVLAHMGVGMLPHYIMHDALASGEVVRVLPEFRCTAFDSKFFILTMPNRFPTSATKAVIELLRATVRNVMGAGEPG